MQKSSTGASPASLPPSVSQTLASPGRPLDAGTRGFMEDRFGQDFGGVRVHTDAAAEQSARDVNARAYTVGQDVAFAQGQYAPETDSGKHLLAHELAHTLQQQGLQRAGEGTLTESSAEYGAMEREAWRAADAVMQGGRVEAPRPASAPQLQRAPWGPCPAGKILPANDPNIYQPAEEYMVAYIKSRRPKNALVDNATPLGTFQPDGPEYDMIQAAAGNFARSRRETKPRFPATDPADLEKLSDEAATTEGPTTKGTATLDVEAVPALLRPDITDFTTREVYDVTTEKQSGGKTSKVADYAARLEAIRKSHSIRQNPDLSWSAGTTLAAPDRISFTLDLPGADKTKKKVTICFGVTDLTARPGVLSYQPIDTAQPAEGEAKEGEGKPEVVTEPYEISLGGQMVTLQALPKPSSTDLLDSGPENKAIAESIPGVILKTLHRKKRGSDIVDVLIETQKQPKSSRKSTMPLEVTGKQALIPFVVNAKTREVKPQKPKSRIGVRYPFLSEGYITEINFSAETGLAGKCRITPSIPLLKGVPLDCEFGEDRLVVTSKMPGDKLRVPIPGVKVTRADISLMLAPEFQPSGTIAFAIGSGRRKLLDGIITVGADSEGFFANGELTAHIPGLDEAKGTVTYRPAAGWSGLITATTSSKSYIQSANVTAAFSDKGMDLSGGVELALPGNNRASLRVSRQSASSWVFTGKGVFRVPRLKPITAAFYYDGVNIKATGTVGVEWKGLEGDVLINYDNGKITGTGTLKINKGKAKGYLSVTRHEDGKFSGTGVVTYQVKEGLEATGGITVDRDEKVTLMGALAFTKPIPLFRRFGDTYTLFSFNYPIPIPGASIGPIGLKVNIIGALEFSYFIGPGELRNTKITATFNPLEDDPNITLQAHTQLYIPAGGELTGKITGEIELDIGIAEAAGGLTLSASAGLIGAAKSDLDVFFSRERFVVSGDFGVGLDLILKLGLTAHVRAEAGVWRFKVTTRKDWKLKEYTYRPGISIGMHLKKPIRYASDEPFVAPSLSDIEWVKPKLDAQDAMEKSFNSSSSKEVEE